jgi:sulfite oxidase
MISRRDLLSTASRLGAAGFIGGLPSGLFAAQETTAAVASWGKDKLIVRSQRPPDYETPVSLLDSFITPAERFYVRCHMPVPSVDVSAWALKVDGEVASPLSLPLDELRKLPATTVTMTLECAGNGRSFFQPAVAGIQWEKGAVGTARWTGVRLAEILKRAGAKSNGLNVVMSAADRPLGTMPPFVRQVPIAKAAHPDTIVAYAMNGQPIPVPHGAPVRAIIPGWEGAYSVKWLTTLTVIDKEFDGFWVASGYRYPTKRVAPGAAVDPKDTAPLKGLVVKSLITQPAEGQTFAPGTVSVAGFAWAGENDITRVDISVDSGESWRPARLTGEQARYSWRRFEFSFAATKSESALILSRATDGAGNVQPAVSQWNPSGYLWNQYDSLRIEIGAKGD